MRIDIMTLFPDAVEAMMGSSIIGRARERGFVTIQTHQIRDYTTNKQMQVDDYPYGGGRGAVMQADPLYRCWQHICDEAGERVHTIYMSPCGRVLTQQVARELKAQYDHLILVCGHYEGVDQRFLDECVDEEISTGDFVLTGGEIAAMAITDAVCRMVPGVLAEDAEEAGSSTASAAPGRQLTERERVSNRARVRLIGCIVGVVPFSSDGRHHKGEPGENKPMCFHNNYKTVYKK